MIAPTSESNERPRDWDELYAKYNPLLLWRALRRGFSREDAQDVVQNTWLRAWRWSSRWGTRHPMGCLILSLKHEMQEERRRVFGRSTPNPQFETNVNWRMEDDLILTFDPDRHDHEELYQAIDRMPNQRGWRTCVLLRLIGRDRHETAALIGCLPDAVDRKMRMARRELVYLLKGHE